MNLVIFIFIVLLGFTSYYFGRKKAYTIQSTNKRLTALPQFYGYYLAIWCAIPAFIIYSLWAIFEPTIVKLNIHFKSLNFMRGRSFNGAYIIIDESQGLTQFQLKSIISRVGSDSKIVVLGNLAQIDNKYISPLTSGLTYLVERAKPYPHAGIMHINGIVRSRLAAFAEENL